MLIESYVGTFVGLQIGYHTLIVAKLQHRAHQLAGNALALGVLFDG